MYQAVEQQAPALRPKARFLAISFERATDLAGQRHELHEELFEVCSDATRSAYVAFGLPRVGTARLYGLRTLRFYIRQALRGRLQTGFGSDVHQMGGDFILDAKGRVRLSFCSVEPADRPAALEVVRELARWI